MGSFRLGPVTLASAWRPLIHPRVLSLSFPALPEIDCSRCRMVEAGLLPARSKCCTQVPDLPSFLVGEILEDGQAAGSPERVAAWVEGGRGDPLFLYAPPALKARHREALERGTLEALPCPLLDGEGRCTIYEHRPYLCVGFHCVYPGPWTFAFWNAVSSLLAVVGAVTAQHLVEALGLDRPRIGALWAARGEAGWGGAERIEPALHADLWQAREPAGFYRAAYRRVVDRADTIRADVDRFRRGQLLKMLEDEGALTDARRAEIEGQPSDPAPREPTLEEHRALSEGIQVFAASRLTIPEHEGLLLWYHRAAAVEAASR